MSAVMVTDAGAVRTVRINRPEKKNALTLAMYGGISQALREADASEQIRCVVIAGAPGIFCAGNDIADFLGAAAGGGLDARALDFLHALAESKKPLVAAVDGAAVGVGTTLLLHCDYVVASRQATLSTPFLKLGLIPEAASTLLAPQRLGYARAFALMVMGQPLSAIDAHAAGLVNVVVDAAELDAVAQRAADEIAALPPQALATARRLMRGDPAMLVKRIDEEAEHFRRLLQTDEARIAFQAFLSRKK
jgi:enoyl-CoA hydratase/carnithine racemase